MDLCERCGWKIVQVFDSSINDHYDYCGCRVPQAPEMRPLVTADLLKKSTSSGKVSSSPSVYLPAAAITNIANSRQPVKYRCLVCSAQLPQTARKEHARNCSIKPSLLTAYDYYKCLSCGKVVEASRLDMHYKQCPESTGRVLPQVMINCPICKFAITKAKFETHLKECRLLASRFKTGEIYRCHGCGESISVSNKKTHSSRCSKPKEASSLQIQFAKVGKNPNTGFNCPFCGGDVRAYQLKQHSLDCRGRYSLIRDTQPLNRTPGLAATPNNDPMGLKALLKPKRPDATPNTVKPDSNSGIKPEKPTIPSLNNPVKGETKVKCPHCKIVVAKAIYEAHYKDCTTSSKRKPRYIPGSNQRPGNWQESFDEIRHSPGTRSGSYQDLGYDDRMDATRGQGYRAREHGRFGSHLVHDNYDD